jgi:N-glycosidase YbiA
MKSTLEFWLGTDFDSEADAPLNFLETRINDLSPFSAHEIEVDGVVYKTVEHAYQSLRALPEARLAIMAARSPLDAWREGQKVKATGAIDPSCDKYALMERLCRAKLAQHPDIHTLLIGTSTRPLLKVHSDNDWGTGDDGEGKNSMGVIWMKLRDELS